MGFNQLHTAIELVEVLYQISVVKETCEAIWNKLYKRVLFTPTENGWRDIAQEFLNKWHFPNCIGALDGKHVSIIVSFF